MSIIQSVALAGASGQGGGGDLGDTVAQSLRFQGGQFLRWDSDTQSGDDRTQWTHSMWVKLAQVGVEDCLFSGWQNSNNRFELTLRTTGQLEITEWGAGSAKVLRLTNRLLRDHSAWYHLVIVYDVDNSTADDQLRLYVNGKRETSFASTANDTGWAGVFGDSGTDAVYGGKFNGSSITNGFDGYIALPIMLDGILVSENADGYITEFGRLNGDGVWVPKDYTGSYGTNGWKLTLDSSQTGSIGEDSGNNNDFTDSSFDKNDIAIYSSGLFTLTDTPAQSNAYLTATGTNWSVGSPANFFDGAGTEVRTSDNAVLRFSTAIPNVTQVQTFTERLGTTNYFNGTAASSSSVDNSWNTIYSGSAIDLTSIVFTTSAQFGTNFKQIRLTTNGTQVELLDNIANDVDFADTPTSNFNTFNPLFVARNTSDGSLRPNVTTAANLHNGNSTSSVAGLTIAKKPPGVDIYFEMDIAFASSAGSPTWNDWWNLIFLHDGPMDTYTWSGTTAPTEAVGGGFAFDFSANLYANNVDESQRMSNTSFANSIAGIKITDTTITVTRDGNSTNVTDLSFANNFDNGMYIVFQNPSTGANEDQKLNFGQMPFIHRPSGLTDSNNLQTNNLPEPTIKNGRDYFDAVTYTGTGNTHTRTDLAFQPDFVWFKIRSHTDSHALYDSVRGAQKRLETISADVESTQGTALTAFNSDGWTMGSDSQINFLDRTYVAWCWKAGGTAVSNTDGTITSSVSANTTAGFSIIGYAGSGTSGDTVGHGLSSTPEFVIIKNRSAAENWQVKHPDLNANQNLELNSTNAVDTAPGNGFISAIGSSTITLSAGASNQNNVNASGNNYIIYAWHSVEGFSKFGSYTGNGDGSSPNSDGPYIFLGFRPALVIIKRTDSSTGGEWSMYDSSRGPVNPNRAVLVADSNASEPPSQDGLDFLSSGFKVVGGNGTFVNITGGNYVYMAFAENPFGGENAPPATAR